MKLKYDLNFTKAVASGNDFLIIDDMDGSVGGRKLDYSALARELCPRKVSVGADGLLVLEKSSKADLKMRIINPDGSEVTMCGNGARCSILYFVREGLAAGKKVITFETGAGILEGQESGGRVKIRMTDPKDIRLNIDMEVGGKNIRAHFLNTGVPHVVYFVEDIDIFPVKDVGRAIRHHSLFAPGGTNANFVGKPVKSGLPVRTYERGVEDETLACGTGSVASAVVSGLLGFGSSPVNVLTKSGEVLTIHFKIKDKYVTDTYLEGEARIVYEGRV